MAAWQLGIPSLHLDLYLTRPILDGPVEWRIDEMASCIKSRGDRCLIVEGVLLLDAINQLSDRALGYSVFVENTALNSLYPADADEFEEDPREFALENQVAKYFRRTRPRELANFVLTWHEEQNGR